MTHGRLSGILLPLFSVRSQSDAGVGDFAALDGLFAWLQDAQQKLFMTLPLLPTAPGDPSPYSTRSAFGLNPLFIHLGWLPEGDELTEQERATLDEAKASKTVRYDLVVPVKQAALSRAFNDFERAGHTARSKEFGEWCAAQRAWLDGYALFTALSEAHERKPWWEWAPPLRQREPKALEEARGRHAKSIRFHQWLQWVAFTQWTKVRAQARARGVVLCGDEPFIISQDSADCWCWPQYLRRDARLGVPPDDFSADGQDWGLPWFDFEALEQAGDGWLKARARHAAATYDVRRIDHAIGYFRQYLRDEAHPRGHFVPGEQDRQRARGERNFKLLSEGAGVVAEDLGVIPRFARDILAHLGIPGYQVMRWSREDGIYRDPRHYPEVSLVTTGTHDTQTMKEWWETAQPWEREAVCRTWPEMNGFQPPPSQWSPEVHESLLRAALNAQSRTCVLPWQDVFGEAERVNMPGTVGDSNWSYRMRLDVEALKTDAEAQRVAKWLARLTREGRRA